MPSISKKHVVRVIALFAALAWLPMLISACGKQKNDADAIRGLIDKGASLAREHAVGGLVDLAAPDFVATPGGYDARGIRGVLFIAFRHYGDFRIHFPKPSVAVEPDGRTASARVHFMIVRSDRAFPGLKELVDDPERWLQSAAEKADLYQLNLTLVKTDDDWRVRTAHLEGFKGTGF